MVNKYDVAAIAAINGIDDGESRKLSASLQREMFGFVFAGRKDVVFAPDNQGAVRIGKWTDPTNYSIRTYSYEELAQAVNERKPLDVE